VDVFNEPFPADILSHAKLNQDTIKSTYVYGSCPITKSNSIRNRPKRRILRATTSSGTIIHLAEATLNQLLETKFSAQLAIPEKDKKVLEKKYPNLMEPKGPLSTLFILTEPVVGEQIAEPLIGNTILVTSN
jgi:hypothetical protein